MLAHRPDLRDTGRRLRRDATFPERLLWSRLRRRQTGHRVLRQRPVGAYVVDFCCVEARVVVEIDGRSHDGRADADAHREHALEAFGLRVLRFSNDEVLTNVDAVARAIAAVLDERTPHSSLEEGGPQGRRVSASPVAENTPSPLRGQPPEGGGGMPEPSHARRATPDPLP